MAKVLFISNIAKRVGTFSVASIAAAKECGLEYYYAANWNAASKEERKEDEEKFGVKLLHVDLVRAPYSLKNLKAYKQIVDIIEKEKIDYIHCNTPIGGILGRLAGKKCKVKKVIYQAHGFHFYKGAHILNWLIYYPIERILAHYTDALLTINQEDYEKAQHFKLRRNGNVYYVPGVGIDIEKFRPNGFNRSQKRKELGIGESDVVIVSAGDLIKRKNYSCSIKAIANSNNKNLQYYICGQGPLREKLENQAKKLGVENQIHFLGFRTDIQEILWAADIFLFTTYQEGLPRSLSEAMASGLPCVVSKIRGNVDLIKEDVIKCLYYPDDVLGFTEAINKLASDVELRKRCGEENLRSIEGYSIETVTTKLQDIYSREFLAF